jgi:chemotaxis protein MotB
VSIRKRSQEHQDEEHIDETWLIPYADLLTLLLALFIVLFSMSKLNEGKTSAMFEALNNAFNNVSIFETNTGGQRPTNTSFSANSSQIQQIQKEHKMESSTDEKKLENLMAQLQQYIDKNHLNALISLTDLKEGIQVTLKDVIVFDSGSDEIKQNFIPVLKDIAGMIKTIDNPIIVEGHTDNRPIHTAKFPSNWELSGARALSVLHYLQQENINPNRLHYVGYGEYHPVYPNDTEEHRGENRRVNILILRKS